MEFKLMEETDLVKCIETFIKVFNDEPWNDEWTFPKAQKYLLDFYQTPGFLGVIVKENEEVMGFIMGVQRKWWSGDEFYIHEMCVDSERQNRGIGKALLDYLIKSLGNNISNITLLTDRGIPAEAFYKKNGFEEIERLVFLSKNLKS
ncbi:MULTISPECIES: GNAT family N-acetyltransferase [Solibacillus]|uniref:GNAT family N-acetyltransferase n=1 Tax=Solibacillus merdavium TaxID=2762218 RepID=A0ABR8XKS8_9BACL|nr:GNAT family N-acetyltransferase [Solibacillus merdavium]MBD8032536.1 GNAT family N-acetyltransferase [Solibacillus merdavium]